MELTPKQQTVELIKQAERILLVTGREPNNDQVASLVALQLALTKMGKQVQAVISDKLPKAAAVLDTGTIARDVTGVRDFVISLNLDHAEVDKLKYHIDGNKLNVVVTPHQGNFEPKDAGFSYGAFQFDLVLALGVTHFAKIDRLIDANPTIFDGLHVVNIDYHRINDNWGSVNLLDQMASCTSEMLVGLLESLEQNVVDEPIATALLTGIMAATNRFTGANTTPKAMTVAAQLMAGHARQQDIVKALYEERAEHRERQERPDRGRQERGDHRQPIRADVKKKNQLSPAPAAQPDRVQPTPAPPSASLTTGPSNSPQPTPPTPTTPITSQANPSEPGEVVLLDRTQHDNQTTDFAVQTFEAAHAGSDRQS